MKLTINDRIKKLKFKKPNGFVNSVLGLVVKKLYYKKCKVEIERKIEPKDFKNTPCIIISNHASRMDYAFILYAMRYRKVNFVIAENELHRQKFKLISNIMHFIPKKNFVPDMVTIKGMNKILKKEKNGCVCIFPCGMSTSSGAQQPSMLGTGKMLKHFKVPVLVTNIFGGYFLSPKFDTKERYGKVKVSLDQLFAVEDLEKMTEAEIDAKIDEALFVDDFSWNKDRQETYDCSWGIAKNLDQILYKCPKCKEEFSMKGENNTLKCTKCGNLVKMDNSYNLIPQGDSKVYGNLREWFDEERRLVRKEVKNPDFYMEEEVELVTLPDYNYVKGDDLGDIVGKGKVRVDNTGFSYFGSRNGKEFNVHINTENINTICLPVDASVFYTYASGEFLGFKIIDKPVGLKLLFAVEEIYRLKGGKWQNYPWFKYE